MKRFRLFFAAAVLALVSTACSSDIVGPTSGQPSFDEVGSGSTSTVSPAPDGQGTFGSGG